jgi:hypothetical protein
MRQAGGSRNPISDEITGSPRRAEELIMTATQVRLAVSDPQAYREKLFKLLGEREPLAVLAETASKLEAIVREHPAAVLRARPFAGKWSANEVIGHLMDSEWVYGYRLRLILSEDDAPIIGTQQEQWVSGLRHNEREPAELVEEFRALRELNLEQWRRMQPAEFERAGQHNERGPESLGLLLRMLAGHDLSHLEQIGRYIEETRSSFA